MVTFDAATREYAELNALLAGGTLEDLERQNVDRQRQQAVAGCGIRSASESRCRRGPGRRSQTCERVAHDASARATAAETQARERAEGVPSVAEAEEAIATAEENSNGSRGSAGRSYLLLIFSERRKRVCIETSRR